MDADENALNRISERIIGGAFTVLNAMGPGFLERVYENCLAHQLRKDGLRVAQQHPIVIRYDDIIVGEYTADLLINDSVIVELKAVRTLDSIHIAQCLNYLKATGLHLALLLNFGHPRLEIRRIVNNL
jgi:GxxExxY protein